MPRREQPAVHRRAVREDAQSGGGDPVGAGCQAL